MKTDDEALNPKWITARLQELLAAHTESMGYHHGWHVEFNVTYRPSDGSGGGVTFTVGTRPADEDEP